MEYKVYNIDPVSKPRMTVSNKRIITPAQAKYNAFKDLCCLYRVEIPSSGFHVIFVVKIPPGLKEPEKLKRLYQPHTFKPDVDNYLKALFDAVHKEDSHIWDCRPSKVWGRKGLIIIITGIETNWISDFVKNSLNK